MEQWAAGPRLEEPHQVRGGVDVVGGFEDGKGELPGFDGVGAEPEGFRGKGQCENVTELVRPGGDVDGVHPDRPRPGAVDPGERHVMFLPGLGNGQQPRPVRWFGEPVDDGPHVVAGRAQEPVGAHDRFRMRCGEPARRVGEDRPHADRVGWPAAAHPGAAVADPCRVGPGQEVLVDEVPAEDRCCCRRPGGGVAAQGADGGDRVDGEGCAGGASRAVPDEPRAGRPGHAVTPLRVMPR